MRVIVLPHLLLIHSAYSSLMLQYPKVPVYASIWRGTPSGSVLIGQGVTALNYKRVGLDEMLGRNSLLRVIMH